jgi:hypothetical protein
MHLCDHPTNHTSTITSPPPQLSIEFKFYFAIHFALAHRFCCCVCLYCLVHSHKQSHYFVLLLPRFRLFLTESCVYVLDYRARVQVSWSVGRERLHLLCYTQRRDIGNSYECFVGLIVNKDEIFIKEAGSHCTRFKDITVHSMRLHKRGEGGSIKLFVIIHQKNQINLFGNFNI